ncbi:MAG: exonuclease domain-containing protein [Pseudomonadota bacterium]|nr:exonuclease domain-containing protein [Pseudomonadota bacterium]
MVKFTYLFYDLETSGLNKSFDQILQFAAKRTDQNLTEQESHFLEVKLLKDMIPSPEAVLTHGIGIADHDSHLEEVTAALMIHRMFNQPNTISLGYNTLGFDDEFLRFTFYRNLLAPYTHQFAQGCKRMDIFPMLIFYYLYAPKNIIWPQLEGRVSLKLEAIAEENNWAVGQAHHAMNDVDATIALAKRMIEDKPVWDYLQGFFDKNIDAERITQLPEAFQDSTGHHLGIMIHPKFGNKHTFQAPVLSLGRHNHYKNQIVFLRLDHNFDDCDFEILDSKGLIIRKKLGEPGFTLPLNERYARHISEERLAICQHNLTRLRAESDELAMLSHEAREYTHPEVDSVDLDAGLYEQGFRTKDEDLLCNRFHLTSPKQKASLIDHFPSSHMKNQAIRLIWRNYPDLLPSEHQEKIQLYFDLICNSEPIYDYRGNTKKTVKEAQESIQSLLLEANETQKKLLLDLKNYLDNLRNARPF